MAPRLAKLFAGAAALVAALAAPAAAKTVVVYVDPNCGEPVTASADPGDLVVLNGTAAMVARGARTASWRVWTQGGFNSDVFGVEAAANVQPFPSTGQPAVTLRPTFGGSYYFMLCGDENPSNPPAFACANLQVSGPIDHPNPVFRLATPQILPGTVGEPVTFDSSASTDPAGNALTGWWNVFSTWPIGPPNPYSSFLTQPVNPAPLQGLVQQWVPQAPGLYVAQGAVFNGLYGYDGASFGAGLVTVVVRDRSVPAAEPALAVSRAVNGTGPVPVPDGGVVPGGSMLQLDASGTTSPEGLTFFWSVNQPQDGYDDYLVQDPTISVEFQGPNHSLTGTWFQSRGSQPSLPRALQTTYTVPNANTTLIFQVCVDDGYGPFYLNSTDFTMFPCASQVVYVAPH